MCECDQKLSRQSDVCLLNHCHMGYCTIMFAYNHVVVYARAMMHVLRICLPLHSLRLSMNKAGTVTAAIDAHTLTSAVALIQYFVAVRIAALNFAAEHPQPAATSAPTSRGSTPRSVLRSPRQSSR